MASLALDTPSSIATNSDTATATVDPGQESPSSETTTLTCSLSTLANEPSPTPLTAPAPTPESNTAPPTPVISSTVVEAKMGPLLEREGIKTPEDKEKTNNPSLTPEQNRPQKSGTPIPPKRRHSPKLAALNAKNSPPVSPLATSSPPTPDTKKPAPSPPVTKPTPQPNTVALNKETPQQSASNSLPEPKPKPGVPDSTAYSYSAFNTDRPTDNNIPTSKPAPSKTPADIPDDVEDPHAENPASLLADVPSPLPITLINSTVPNDLLTPGSELYELTAPNTGHKNADLELELRNGTGRPSRPLSDLISLESPSAAPSLPSGHQAGFPPSGPVLEASETLKTAPPVNDEYGSL